MAWQTVADVAEVPTQGFKAIDMAGTPILIGRAEGQWFACLDRCPHAGAPLRIGTLRGEELQCPRHGWLFNVITGCSVPDDPAFRLAKIPTKVDSSHVFVEL